MIRKILKWIGIVLGGLVGLLVLTVIVLYIVSVVKWNQAYENYDVPVETIAVPTSEEAVAHGEHVATIHACRVCHGENLGGKVLIDQPALGVVYTPNLTSGAGGVGATNTDEDWVRAIRHGVGHDRRGLVAMPSRIFYMLGDEDLGALIAYLKALPPVDNETPKRQIGPAGRLAVVLNQFPQAHAALIDHDAPRPAVPEQGVTVEYGEYLALTCTMCHGASLNGGFIRASDGELVRALNLTPGGELRVWSEEQFFTTLRTGVTPSGRQLTVNMPWKYIGQMTDDELKAVWLYLQSLPALEQGEERTDR